MEILNTPGKHLNLVQFSLMRNRRLNYQKDGSITTQTKKTWAFALCKPVTSKTYLDPQESHLSISKCAGSTQLQLLLCSNWLQLLQSVLSPHWSFVSSLHSQFTAFAVKEAKRHHHTIIKLLSKTILQRMSSPIRANSAETMIRNHQTNPPKSRVKMIAEIRTMSPQTKLVRSRNTLSKREIR